MFWLLAASFLFFISGLLWLWWRRASRDGLPFSAALLVPVAVLVGLASYGLWGMHRELPQWLADVWRYDGVAAAIARGEQQLDQQTDIPPAVLARVLQRQLHHHDSAQGWYALATLWAELGADRMVALSAEQAAQRDPSAPEYPLMWAQSLIQQAEGGLTPEAETKIREVLAQHPDHQGAWAMLAAAAMRGAQFDTAVEAWEQLLTSHGEGEVAELLQRMRDQAREQLAIQQHFSPLTVEVSANTLRPGGTLFVFLRQPGVQGQPLAARRLVADRFPVTVEIAAADWLQAMPSTDTLLEASARYSTGVGGVESATQSAQPVLVQGEPGRLRAQVQLP